MFILLVIEYNLVVENINWSMEAAYLAIKG